ncbi:MAG: AbrB/MazE/SpoVT family DNA-binding domain-containing protein [Abditibacteriales bacterium]|nr:AbrB/MazE/SpoVT family DNA-binding domain-containing protein [Abditibacteriales bacterium]MDW8366813.1 AbrB/MazE/SpoVT family DNA-binding domain-containing protein [Abditibacteriales bacterium]
MPKQQPSIDELFLGAATVGERWQIVIPRDACRRYNINPKDKVLVFAHPQANGFLVCKASALEHVVREMKATLRLTKKPPTSTKAKPAKRKEDKA